MATGLPYSATDKFRLKLLYPFFGGSTVDFMKDCVHTQQSVIAKANSLGVKKTFKKVTGNHFIPSGIPDVIPAVVYNHYGFIVTHSEIGLIYYKEAIDLFSHMPVLHKYILTGKDKVRGIFDPAWNPEDPYEVLVDKWNTSLSCGSWKSSKTIVGYFFAIYNDDLHDEQIGGFRKLTRDDSSFYACMKSLKGLNGKVDNNYTKYQELNASTLSYSVNDYISSVKIPYESFVYNIDMIERVVEKLSTKRIFE